MDTVESFIDRWRTTAASERAAEEAAGRIRWLRPDYQAPGGKTENSNWRNRRCVRSVRSVRFLRPPPPPQPPCPPPEEAAPVAAAAIPALAARLAGRTTPKRRAQLQAILETPQTLGHG